MKQQIIVIGSGLAGMSAALTMAEQGNQVALVSSLSAERAQSVMAEGGINAAMNTAGEGDDPAQHAEDTLKSAAGIVSEKAVQGLTEMAPKIVTQLHRGGVQFNVDAQGQVAQRPFGGQKKKRTAYARDDTGKQLMTAMIDAVRKWEDQGVVVRYPHHQFLTLLRGQYQDITKTDRQAMICGGVVLRDVYSGEIMTMESDGVIIATGGMHGLFEDTTGSLNNTGEVTAELFRLGIPLANGEFIQYHPTTVEGNGKRMLITEAARGEGGRLFAWKNGEKWYFMEERYPELGNLMPRDVTAREIWRVLHEEKREVFLDLTTLPVDVLVNRLSGLVRDCKKYLSLDPAIEPIPVAPGIHYFMGGLQVDDHHRTGMRRLYAAGECCAQYHGANRLGGNSLLGAIYGGHVAGNTACREAKEEMPAILGEWQREIPSIQEEKESQMREIRHCLQHALGVVRDAGTLEEALRQMEAYTFPEAWLGRAMLSSALAREESRGGHFRRDFPDRDDAAFQKITVAEKCGEQIHIRFQRVTEEDA